MSQFTTYLFSSPVQVISQLPIDRAKMKLGTHSDRLRMLRLTLEAEEEQETDPFDIPEDDEVRIPVEQPIAKKVSGTVSRLLLKHVPAWLN